MANTLNGTFLAQIAQDTLDYLSYEFHPLAAFTRDFNEDIKDRGESVTTRVASSVTAQDLSSGYSSTDVTSTAKTVSLNTHYGFVYGFSDAEVSKAGDSKWLENVFMAPALEAVHNKIMDDLLALATNASFGSSEVITAANFDADEVADLAADFSGNKIPKNERSLILPPSYFGSIQKDSIIQDSSSLGSSEAIREHAARRVHGFNLYEYSDIPNNSENLAAIALHPSALIMAARQVATPNDPGLLVENVTTDIGLPLQFRHWYSPNDGEYKISLGVLYGVAIGNSGALGSGGALKRIKSA